MKKIFNFNIWWKEIDKINFILISILLIIGMILSFSLNESFFILNKHLFFSFFAFFIMIYLSSLEAKTLRRISLIFFIFFLFVLFIVLFSDYEVKGSKRWLRLYSISIQPSEFIKPFFFILSAWFIVQGINGRNLYLIILSIKTSLVEKNA